MISGRFAITVLAATAVSGYTAGVIQTKWLNQSDRVSYDTKLDALRTELQQAIAHTDASPVATVGRMGETVEESSKDMTAERDQLVADIKKQLRAEMGLLPVQVMRDRRASFVELHSVDSRGSKHYGTAGYLGDGYFITVKHAVVALEEEDGASDKRTMTSFSVVYKDRDITARLVDAGSAKTEVDPGDWAIIRTRVVDLPALTVDPSFAYDFAEPIVRFGNDYSKGVVVSTGYIGQRTSTGLVTSLTDGHPGASGGGVLDSRGVLVGIPIGRMQGDYRFSFILPLRSEMFRRVPAMSVQPHADPPAETTASR